MMAVTARWAKLKVVCARWALAKFAMPVSLWLNNVIRESASDLKEQHDKARLRLEVCKRCPAYTKFNTCRECGCFMPAKVQIKNATCPQGRW